MSRRHIALPTLWLMTDERQAHNLWPALERLPRGAGVVIRHYSLPEQERRHLARRIGRIARRRGLVMAFGGPEAQARRAGAKAVYGAALRPSLLPRLYPTHNPREIVNAARIGAALLFLSPVFPTRSHPEARALGAVRFGLIARSARAPVIALGGMTSRRHRRIRALGAQGWAGIDAWIRT
jgi:thiamine-phosphate pyrophosphorylase